MAYPRDHAAAPSAGFTRYILWAGFAIGFALGGFFDGILLHQILQWHHMLSAVEGAAYRDIRVQIVADGAFHAAMYVIAGVGLWLQWRGRRELDRGGAGRYMAGWGLVGFGVWHVIDGVLSHWVLGIHRIRMDVANPLFWDVLWIAVFGIAFVVAGWLALRGGAGGGSSSRRRAIPVALVLAVLIAGPLAALPPRDVSTVIAVFGPGTAPADVFAAAAAADGRVVWNDPSQTLWAIDIGPEGSRAALYRHGALLASNGFLPAGCLNWIEADDRLSATR